MMTANAHCGGGGTGRRARFRVLWGQPRGGSNPPLRTNPPIVVILVVVLEFETTDDEDDEDDDEDNHSPLTTHQFLNLSLAILFRTFSTTSRSGAEMSTSFSFRIL